MPPSTALTFDTLGLPGPWRALPPPCGWSTAFMLTPHTRGFLPSQRLAPALPSFTLLWSTLPTRPTEA